MAKKRWIAEASNSVRSFAGYGGFASCLWEWSLVTITHTQLQIAALTNNITAWTLPAGCILVYCRLKISVPFLGGAITDYFLSLGPTAGSLQDIMTEYDALNIVVGNQEYAESMLFQSWNYAASVPILIGARSVGGNLSLSTQGTARLESLYIKKP